MRPESGLPEEPENGTKGSPTEPLPPVSLPAAGPGAQHSPGAPAGVSTGATSIEPPTVAGYQILQRLGEGGMGIVWRAIQLSTRREVALKLLRGGPLVDERVRKRFDREIELTARLEHPDIARVYDSGLLHGAYYYAMELIDGVPIDRFVRGRKLSQRQIIELARRVCQAVQHAHQRGVIHRDLKPSNILVSADGRPHLVDFGLAKLMLRGGLDAAVSLDGEVAGTPAFMAPEQASGRGKIVDTRTDVYALGVVLYHLLTGESPHDVSGSHVDVMRRISTEDPRRPRQVCPEIDRELESVLLKALSRDPDRRYSSAGALAEDLGNYLRGEPLAAKAQTTAYFLRKWLRKHRAGLAIAAGAALLVAVLGTVIHVSGRSAREARAEAKRQAELQSASVNFLGDMIRQAASNPVEARHLSLADFMERVADRLKVPPERAELEGPIRRQLGVTLLFLSRPRSAETQLRRSVELLRAANKPQLLAPALGDLGRLLAQQGRLTEALEMQREALDEGRRSLGESNPTTQFLMAMLGESLLAEGKIADADPLIRRALQLHSASSGPDHPDTLTIRTAMARLLAAEQKFPEAEAEAHSVLAGRRKAFGGDRPESIAAADLLVEVLIREGKLAEAEPLARENVAASQKLYGPEQDQALQAMLKLGTLLQERGKLDEAEATFREVLQAARRVDGPNHQLTGYAAGNLASILAASGNRLSEAEESMREACNAFRASLGTNDPRTIQARQALAGILVAQGKTQEADALRAAGSSTTRSAQPSR